MLRWRGHPPRWRERHARAHTVNMTNISTSKMLALATLIKLLMRLERSINMITSKMLAPATNGD